MIRLHAVVISVILAASLLPGFDKIRGLIMGQDEPLVSVRKY